ncbi:MAG TPA: isochorismate synthase [Rubricoccaceae bacterium]|nr:isochorismate synthase [Rubricoccaceae bacterium]
MPDATLLDPLAPASVRRALADAARRARRSGAAPVARVEVPVEAMDPLAWLAVQPHGRRFFWEGREEKASRAAAGEALVVEADSLDALTEALAPHLDGLPDGARFFGYARFAPDAAPDAAWAAFGRVRFALPRFELRADGGGATLALHLTEGDDEQALTAALDALVFSSAPLAQVLPAPMGRTDAPDEVGWHEAVTWALRRFEEGPLEKVVLARCSRFTFDAPLDPFALLGHLRAATPGGYRVLVEAGEAAFSSVTPERLLRVDGREVMTEAVAGTRPRGREDAADRRLRAALLGSEKDLREHAYVRDAVAAALAPLTERLDRDGAPSTLAGAGVRHLYTRLRGTLREGASALDVLRALHPTPAVGGTPAEAARAAIRRMEPFDRGLYAGPVGWVGRDAAEFAVGIRSGLVHGRVLDLFSGAGIVAGSDPAEEWAEIEHKLGDFLRVLGLGDGA